MTIPNIPANGQILSDERIIKLMRPFFTPGAEVSDDDLAGLVAAVRVIEADLLAVFAALVSGMPDRQMQIAIENIARVIEQDRAAGGHLFLMLDDDIETIRAFLTAVPASEPVAQVDPQAIIDEVSELVGTSLFDEVRAHDLVCAFRKVLAMPAAPAPVSGTPEVVATKWAIYYDNLGEQTYTSRFMNEWNLYCSQAEAEAEISQWSFAKHYSAREVAISVIPARQVPTTQVAPPANAVSGMPDLASLPVILNQFSHNDVTRTFYEPHNSGTQVLIAKGYTPKPLVYLADVERLLNPTGETK